MSSPLESSFPELSHLFSPFSKMVYFDPYNVQTLFEIVASRHHFAQGLLKPSIMSVLEAFLSPPQRPANTVAPELRLGKNARGAEARKRRKEEN